MAVKWLAGQGMGLAYAAKPAEVAYQLGRGAPHVPTPIAVGDLLFAWDDGGIVSCLRAATG